MQFLNLTLRAEKPELNLNRVYQIRVEKGLFGSWCVLTAYGRYGGGSHQKIHSFFTLQEAKAFVRTTLKKRSQAEKRIGCSYRLISKDYSKDFAEVCAYPNFS